MRAKELLELMGTCYDLRQALYIEGAPGVGKTQLARQFAASRKLEILDLRLVHMESVDLVGLMKVVDGVTRWFRPGMLPTDGAGIVFMDEFPQAHVSVQNVAAQLTLDRRIGEWQCPDGWGIFAAGNRQKDRAATNKIPSHLVSRFWKAELETSLEDWSAWAIKAGVHPMALAYIRFSPDQLHSFDGSKWDGGPFPCPRTWEIMSKSLCLGDTRNTRPSLEAMAGLIGEGSAIQFRGFLDMTDQLPAMEAILLDPSRAPVPEEHETGKLNAIATGLGRHANYGNFGRVVTYLDRLPVREFRLMGVRDSLANDAKIMKSPDFTAWYDRNQDLWGGGVQ